MKLTSSILGVIMIMANWVLTVKPCLSPYRKELLILKSKELTLFKLVGEETTPYIYLLRAKRSGVDLMLWANLEFQHSL
jgi:hypothetical protein